MLNITKNTIKENINTDELHSMSMIHGFKPGKQIAKILIWMGLFFFIVLFFPWQQNVFSSEGALTALMPQDRPQMVETVIGGRIKKWYMMEGMHVNKGDTLAVLTEIKDKFFDPELLKRMTEQLDAKEGGIDANRNKVKSYESQINALENSYIYSLNKAKNKVKQVALKVVSDSVDLNAEKVNIKVAEDQYARSEVMLQKGLLSVVEIEKRKMKLQESIAKLQSQTNKLATSRNELLNVKIELNSIAAEYNEKISKATSDLNATKAYVFEATGDYSKLRNEFANVSIRSGQYYILAPQSGILVRTLKSGLGETLKEGEALATIMPDNPHLAAEIYVYPMDVPLLSEGRKVRLEFEGFPAMQFSGWPSVAVGTFGGIVKVIDFVESKNGKFRVLVVPDPNDTPWPSRLRMGVGARGWAMLDDVPIWFEIWRLMNGFPPSLKKAPEEPVKAK